jgi:photosystem II stability/assembly factor-like uncharacterized protein
LVLFFQAPQLDRQTSGTAERLQALSVVDERVVWVSGTGGTWGKTTDGGVTWRMGVVRGADTLEFRGVHGVDSTRAYLLAAGPGRLSAIYATSDGGATWRRQFLNLDPAGFFDCFAFWNADAGILMADAVNGAFPLLRTTDGGRQWLPLRSAPIATKGEGAFAASGTCVATFGDSLAWIATGAGERARILRTADRGASWSSVTTPIAQGTATTGHAAVAFRGAQDGIAVGGDIVDTLLVRPDNVVLTSDGGATWTRGGTLSFPGAAYGAAFVPDAGATVVAVGPRGASWSTDGGRNWAALDTLSHWSVAFASRTTGWMVGPRGRITRIRLP